MKDGMSEFKRVTSGAAEAEKNKPRIRFKVVPPPPKPKAEPPPPPPPPRRSTSPRLRRQKRKVEVDAFRICWKDSWMSLKPPKYLFLKAQELQTRILGFTTIELTKNSKYKAKGSGLKGEWMFPAHKWNQSWKQVQTLKFGKYFGYSPDYTT